MDRNNNNKEKILVTSALPYVNNVPHLGNIIGCVLSADVFARFQRSRGKEVIYICGTDEHGTTTETKAKKEGLSPKEICDKYYNIHKEIYEWFNISFDYFGRTSTEEHKELTQKIFLKLKENGFILKKKVKQLYSEKSQTFLADRYVKGTCPYCGYEEANGDQCDNCGKLLTPTELIDPISKIDGSKPIIKETEHYFINLPKLEEELKIWVESQSISGNWTENAVKITNNWFKEGLKERAITRDLKWGVPVPDFPNKVFYVWFDAPIGYISITKKAFPNTWKEWWFNKNVKLYQFMGKDNVPFHTILFPATLIGTRDNYILAYHINSTEYLNYENTKFSKSKGIGVFGDDAIKTGIKSDVFRYYLLINRPEHSDTKFLWDDFKDRNNNELVANLGNLINRVITFINKEFNGFVEEKIISEKALLFWDKVKEEESVITELMENINIRESLKRIMLLSKMGNQFFQEREPWKKIKSEELKEEAKETLFFLANLVKDLGILLEPFLPDTSKKIFDLLNTTKKDWKELGTLTIKNKIKKPELLFEKISDEKIEFLKEKYGGKKEEINNKKNNNKIKNNKEQENKKKNSEIIPIELIVAKIIDIKDHPKADKLYIETIDLGPLGKKQIISGLKPYYKKEELLGKNIILVNNLKKAKLRGEESEGMLLAGEEKGNIKVLFVNEKPGTRLIIEGEENNNIKEITIKEFFKRKIVIENHKVLIDNKKILINNKELESELKKGIVR